MVTLNNAQQVLDDLRKNNGNLSEQHLTMVEAQGSGDVPIITDSNIHNNSKFIVNLWD